MAKVTQLKIELEQEEDGRWIGEVPTLPGVMAYGQTKAVAIAAVQALALRAMADRLEHHEAVPEELLNVSSLRHEPLAFDPSLPRSFRSPSHRLANQTHYWFSQSPSTNRLA